MAACTRLPEYGPLAINNLQEFLNDSKQFVSERFDSNTCSEYDLQFESLIHVQTIGVGSFGTILLMKGGNEDKYYAVKAIDKRVIVKTKQVHHIHNEKKILSVMNFPFIIHLVQFNSDNSYLYFVLPFIAGGDLFNHLKKAGKFDDGLSRFYASQVVLALEYLHFLDLIYRDLKPENVLLDHTGYVKITDFGFGKALKSRTWTLCGTPEYLAPEIVLNRGYSKAVDWWALGVFIFEMVTGRSPFFAKEQIKIYEKILANRYVFPHHVSPDSKDLIRNLLQPTISLRLGSLKNGVDDIKSHIWFRPIEWLAVLNRKMDPPFVPESAKAGGNFKDYKDVSLKVSETQRFIKEFEHF